MKRRDRPIVNRLVCVMVAVPSLAGVPAFAAGEDSRRAAPAASELLPPEVREGPHHLVEEEVETDGFIHVFTVHSPFGRFEVHGGDRLLHRVAEIEALGLLLEWREEAIFTAAEERAGPLPWSDALGADDDFESSRRELAHVLGVDPYTDMPRLDEALDRFAWAMVSGGLPLPSADPARDLAHGANLRVHGLLRDHDEEDLERLNRIELAVMGVPEATREAFLDHPDYGSHHETALVDALAAMEETEERDDFIDAALGAESPMEAHRYRRAAEMMRDYHEETARLGRIEMLDEHPAAFSEEGVLVAPVRADHATWTPELEGLADDLMDAAEEQELVEEEVSDEEADVHILFEGSLSGDVRERLEAMGHRVDSEEALWMPRASDAGDEGGSPK